LQSLAAGGLGIVLVDHDMGLVLSVCETVVVLERGRVIADGDPDDVRRDEAVLDAYLGHGAMKAAAS
jgi:ABC-type branched-subunit amino acid transport system ATPase component